MNKNFALIFGGIVAYILLLLYAGSVAYMTKTVIKREMAAVPLPVATAATPSPKKDFAPGLVNVVTIIGGLVSALVISQLAVAKPGANPAQLRLAADASDLTKKLSNFLTGAYLMVWLVTGLGALIIGVMIFPESNSTLGELGTTWLGLAVASGYAYFGISPK